jgi:hypothetical protein
VGGLAVNCGSTVGLVTERKRPTSWDRTEATRIALTGIAVGDGLTDLYGRLAPLHPKDDTFPGEVFLELAADAITEAGASRDRPIEFGGIRERYLPECTAHTKAQHHKSKYALRAAAMVRAGVDPGLLDEIVWWRTDDLWSWALDALVVYVRVAAERTGESIAAVCEPVAVSKGVEWSGPR